MELARPELEIINAASQDPRCSLAFLEWQPFYYLEPQGEGNEACEFDFYELWHWNPSV